MTKTGDEDRIHSLLTKEVIDVNNIPLWEAQPPPVGSLQSVPGGSYSLIELLLEYDLNQSNFEMTLDQSDAYKEHR